MCVCVGGYLGYIRSKGNERHCLPVKMKVRRHFTASGLSDEFRITATPLNASQKNNDWKEMMEKQEFTSKQKTLHQSLDNVK